MNKKIKPLKEKDLWFCEACGGGITCKEDVLSALALAKSDMNKLLQFEKISKEGSAGIKLCLSIIDECFQIEQSAKGKNRLEPDGQKESKALTSDSLSILDSSSQDSAQDNQEQEAKK